MLGELKKLYECFTPDELQRLYEIKTAPGWTPRELRRENSRDSDDSRQVNFVISKRLKDRLDARCAALHITIREYMTALLEVMLS